MFALRLRYTVLIGCHRDSRLILTCLCCEHAIRGSLGQTTFLQVALCVAQDDDLWAGLIALVLRRYLT